MMTTLEAHGYPNISNEEIMAILPRLWTVVADLVPKDSGFGYQEFLMVAQQEYVKAQIEGF